MLKRLLIGFIALLYFSVVMDVTVSPLQGQSCSSGTGETTAITFVNNITEDIYFYWVNFECQEVQYGVLTPGQSYTHETGVGHEWVIRNGVGMELERVFGVANEVIVVEIGAFIDQPIERLCSLSGTQTPASVMFTNDSAEEVEIFWVNFECQEVSYGTLLANLSFEQETADGHEWVMRTLTGEEVAYGMASSETLVVISPSNQITSIEPITDPLGFKYRPDRNWSWSVIEGYAGCEVRPTTPEDGLDPFYQKICNADGQIPIASSNNVPDEALQAAWNIMVNMLQGHMSVVDKMVEMDMMVGIVAESEGITLLPQYAFLRDDPQTNWDERARGLGGTPFVPLVSGAEENLLCYTTDGYFGESIFLHELAHTIKDSGIALIDPTFNMALDLAYQQAIQQGLWANTYALETVEEYWAEGVQSYFNTNLEAIPTNGIHNDINTREELMNYDPTLFAIIDTVFKGFEWIPTCP